MIVAITQARMTSTRLPGKVLKEAAGRPLLAHHLSRVCKAKSLDAVVCATTTNPCDDPIANLALSLGAEVFRGSELDVLSRYAAAANFYGADVIVRVTADNPMIDPAVIDLTVTALDGDYASNHLPPTFPRGMEVEVMTRKALEEADFESTEREHVTPFIWGQPRRYRLINVRHSADQSHHRWTVDEPADLELVRRMLEALPEGFALKDALDLAERHPEWAAINRHVRQIPVYANTPERG